MRAAPATAPAATRALRTLFASGMWCVRTMVLCPVLGILTATQVPAREVVVGPALSAESELR